MSSPETKLQRTILDLLLLRGVFAWRSNAGFLRIGARVVELAPPGSPDIVGVLPGGQFIGIEVKLPGEALRQNQQDFHDRLARSGAAVAVVHSVAEVQEVLDRYLVRKPAVRGPNILPGR